MLGSTLKALETAMLGLQENFRKQFPDCDFDDKTITLSKGDCLKWWSEKETQDITVNLMKNYPITLITSDLNETKNEIIVNVATADGLPIDGFLLSTHLYM